MGFRALLALGVLCAAASALSLQDAAVFHHHGERHHHHAERHGAEAATQQGLQRASPHAPRLDHAFFADLLKKFDQTTDKMAGVTTKYKAIRKLEKSLPSHFQIYIPGKSVNEAVPAGAKDGNVDAEQGRLVKELQSDRTVPAGKPVVMTDQELARLAHGGRLPQQEAAALRGLAGVKELFQQAKAAKASPAK